MNIPIKRKDHYNREINTARLIQFISQREDFTWTADSVYNLTRLTWLMNSVVKALNYFFKTDYFYEEDFLEDVNIPKNIRNLIKTENGYINFYHAYRNSSQEWVKENWSDIRKIIKIITTYTITDADRIRIAGMIERLPGISKPKSKKNKLPAINFLSPLLASLDKEHRFPIINSASGIVRLHKKLKICNSTLAEKLRELFDAMEKYDIKNAFEMDVLSDRILEKIKKGKNSEIKALENRDSKYRSLMAKDDSDVDFFIRRQKRKFVRLHNTLTNDLKDLCELNKYKIIEGTTVKYDALIKNYYQDRDLLIEVKSSNSPSDIRLAIGQLFDYASEIRKKNIDLALVVPDKPNEHYLNLLKKLNIDIYWKNDDTFIGTGNLKFKNKI